MRKFMFILAATWACLTTPITAAKTSQLAPLAKTLRKYPALGKYVLDHIDRVIATPKDHGNGQLVLKLADNNAKGSSDNKPYLLILTGDAAGKIVNAQPGFVVGSKESHLYTIVDNKNIGEVSPSIFKYKKGKIFIKNTHKLKKKATRLAAKASNKGRHALKATGRGISKAAVATKSATINAARNAKRVFSRSNRSNPGNERHHTNDTPQGMAARALGGMTPGPDERF